MVPEATPDLTFLFTDIESSSRLWEEDPQAMEDLLDQHNEVLRQAIAAHRGSVFKTVGDGFCATFPDPIAALRSSLEAQIGLQTTPSCTDLGPLRVRMALHTGPARVIEGDYFGPSVNRVARLLAVGHGGQVLVSEATRRRLESALPPSTTLLDLGTHELKDMPEPQRVYQLMHPKLNASFPPLRSLSRRLDNLPPSRTTFVGRARDITRVAEKLRDGSLITLSGIGGTGKTRLAIEVASAARDAFPDGVWMVELAPLTDPALVSRAVADAVGIGEEPGRSLDATLCARLHERCLLLLFDNCEHVLDGAASLADKLLDHCPSVKILATSREPLTIDGEQIWPVAPLDIPVVPRSGLSWDDSERLRDYESVQLFEERALAVLPSFRVDATNADPVARIVSRLEGLPLAIELAAARVQTLPPQQLANRLEDRFRYLTGGSRMALPKHRTLRAAIDWSYDLLNQAERALLARLSVFRGSFELASAEAVSAGPPIETQTIVELLSSLVLKSLVELNEESRYRLLETVREYAAQKLLDSGEAFTYWERHRDRYIELAESSAVALTGPEQGEWLKRLEEEHDNFRIALEWSLEQRDAVSALRLSGALGRFWSIHGHSNDGRAWLGQALACDPRAPTELRAEATRWAGHLARTQGDLDAAQEYLDLSLALFEQAGDQRGIAAARNALGILANVRGDTVDARAHWKKSLACFRQLADQRGIAAVLANLGLLERTLGAHQRSRELLEESLLILREVGDKGGISSVVNNLAVEAFDRGEFDRAWSLNKESLELDRELDHPRGIAQSTHNLALIASEWGDFATAREMIEEAQRITRELGDRQSEANELLSLASVLLGEGRAEDGARVQGSAVAFLESIGAALDRREGSGYDQVANMLRTALGDVGYEAAWESGRALSIQEATALARRDTQSMGESNAQHT